MTRALFFTLSRTAFGSTKLCWNMLTAWRLVGDKLLDIVLKFELNGKRKVKVKATIENWFMWKLLLHRTFKFSLQCYIYHIRMLQNGMRCNTAMNTKLIQI